mmetsp:Transcript_23783/g.41730  ORF Transcript_23783/g.41730 Transcript_23783/m.41730 type:complete len:97 (+) Transcript_23783:1183-1473(+)
MACPAKMQMIGKIGSKKRNSLCSENECKTMYGATIPRRATRGLLYSLSSWLSCFETDGEVMFVDGFLTPFEATSLIIARSQRKKGSMIPQMAGMPA